jgi:hypothetical protein
LLGLKDFSGGLSIRDNHGGSTKFGAAPVENGGSPSRLRHTALLGGVSFQRSGVRIFPTFRLEFSARSNRDRL